jgi:hypothetical protein
MGVDLSIAVTSFRAVGCGLWLPSAQKQSARSQKAPMTVKTGEGF